ncbi:DUF2490 domain-containing protein [Telluribacter sp.]|jgi:hypothetical protein|uniref:DUF2490 domain-containing protein n=1 Tax=Telluribacter sp. TaxID=1978767 RepID=UPI002E10705C|nr:DUF2490 domain-containing protein [Telluribacter sp.]
MKKQALTILSLLLFSVAVMAQPVKQINESTQLWTAYLAQARLSDQWGLWTDVHLRTKEDLVSGLSSSIVRVGLMYYLNDHTKLTAGYAFINHFPAEGHAHISQPEHRPWQQIQWHNNGPKSRLTQWIRLEERYRRRILNDSELADGYTYGTRVRYNLLAAFPLTKKGFTPGGLSLVLNDEVHLNIGRKVVYNYFDQNRFFVGLGYQLGRHTTLQTGYMNVFQQLSAGNRYRNLHTARVFLLQNLDWRKPKG